MTYTKLLRSSWLSLNLVCAFTLASKKSEEKTVIVVGEGGSGKTSLIHSLIGKTDTEAKPTVGMEFNFGRKTVDSKKEIANYYEVAGGKDSAKML